jgi:hypothetical protein
MSDPGLERRKYPRLRAETTIAVARVDGSGRLAYGRDLSLGGVRFQIFGAEIEIGELLRVYLSFEDETVSALGRVVWATEVDAFTTDVGMEFVEVDDVDLEKIQKLAPE